MTKKNQMTSFMVLSIMFIIASTAFVLMNYEAGDQEGISDLTGKAGETATEAKSKDELCIKGGTITSKRNGTDNRTETITERVILKVQEQFVDWDDENTTTTVKTTATGVRG